MNTIERAQAMETAGQLAAMRTEVDALPEGPWHVVDGSIQTKDGHYVVEAVTTCGPQCWGDVSSSVNYGAESFLANSGDRSRAMIRALQSVLALHKEIPTVDEYGEHNGGTCCEECTDLDDHSGERVHSEWPCSTVDEIVLAMAGEETRTEFRARMDAHVDAVLAKRGLTAEED